MLHYVLAPDEHLAALYGPIDLGDGYFVLCQDGDFDDPAVHLPAPNLAPRDLAASGHTTGVPFGGGDGIHAIGRRLQSIYPAKNDRVSPNQPNWDR